MGGYLTRNRAWVHIAFYDDYANRHIAWTAGVAILYMIPMYWYGININRIHELNGQAYYYYFTHADKRNRLTHNMIMEHFEMHVEEMQDFLIDIKKNGSRAFTSIKLEGDGFDKKGLNQDMFAFIDDLSGFRDLTYRMINDQKLPLALQDKLLSRLTPYTGKKTKEEVAYEVHERFFGRQR